MGIFQKWSTLAKAEFILALAGEELTHDDPDFLVGAFRSGNAHGLQISAEDLDRKANVLGNSSSDGYVLTFGARMDYDYESGHSLDTVKRFDFGHDEPVSAAKCLVNWLRSGQLPSDREPSAF